ncbi:hypothetical protein Cgig2_002710 [Carnegiea gigantea]|uniref:DUF4283 domain-containing protein n=1 Tax=Carnegiea gigantea TaxID=171969 RepID=A0A9Q1GK90_9CARY|nr:hypothetical protein Cgig2_002710 [Carnegiea gigantea]
MDEGQIQEISNAIVHATIEQEEVSHDVNPEIEYWKSVVLCSVLGPNPPLEVIEGFIRRIWKAFDIDKICMVRKGVFLLRFNNFNDQLTVVKRGVFFFDMKPFLVKPWNEEMDINTEAITSLPISARFLDLDIKYWCLESLSKIDSILGIPIKTDKYTKEKTMLKYARLLIEC